MKIKRLLISILGKLSYKNVWIKLTSTLIAAFLIRYTIIYYQNDIVNTYFWIKNDWVFAMAVYTTSLSKTVLESYIDSLPQHRFKWVLKLLSYIEDATKTKHTIGGLDNNTNLFMDQDKGKGKADNIPSEGTRSAPTGWDPEAEKVEYWHRPQTEGPWKDTPIYASTHTQSKLVQMNGESSANAYIYTRDGRVSIAKTNHVVPVQWECARTNKCFEKWKLMIFSQHAAIKAQLECHKNSYKMIKTVITSLNKFHPLMYIKDLDPSVKNDIDSVIFYTKSTTYPIITFDGQDVELLIRRLEEQANRYSLLYQDLLVNQCVALNTKYLKNRVGLDLYEEEMKKAFNNLKIKSRYQISDNQKKLIDNHV